MRVVVHQVDPHVARADDPQDRVHVGSVQIEQRPAIMKQARDFADLGVEQADRVGVGDHEDGRLVAQLGFEVGEIDEPARIALDGDGFKSGEVRRGWVGSVRTVRDQHLSSRAALVLEVGRGDEKRRQLSLRAGGGLQADRVQPGDLGQDFLELEKDRQQALERALVLIGMLRGEPRQRGQPLVPLGVVLHRARAERIESSNRSTC